jgi:hypothetical protein
MNQERKGKARKANAQPNPSWHAGMPASKMTAAEFCSARFWASRGKESAGVSEKASAGKNE